MQEARVLVKRFWDFLQKDSWLSWLVSLLLLIVLIKFVVFPALSLVTGSKLPLVVVESCSMYHPEKFDEWWFKNGEWYKSKGIEKEEFLGYIMRNGFSKGDIIIVWGYSDYKKGDVIIFNPSDARSANPIIHRIVTENPIGTKGDHNSRQLEKNNNLQQIDETSIEKSDIIGKAVARIPALGWIKLIFFELGRPADQRGLCN